MVIQFLEKILKLLGKGSLINVKVDNRKTINLYNINSPTVLSSEKNTILLEYEENKKELFDINKINFIREDLVSSEMALIALPEEYKKMLKEVKPYINLDDYSTLRLAYAIKKLNLEANITEGENAREKLRKKFGERGNRINNLVAVGHFENHIYPRLLSIIEDPQITNKEKEFKDFLDRMINLYPFAIWVSEGLSKESLISQVSTRLNTLKSPQVSIHSAGGTNRIVEELIKEVKEEKYNFVIVELREYMIGGRLKALELIVKLKADKNS